jgi:hypothetical protein
MKEMEDSAATRSQKTTWLLLLAVPLLLAAGAFAALFLRPPSPVLPPISTSVTVLRPAPSVLLSVRDLARLETAEFHMERVVDLRDRQTHLFGLVKAEDALLLVAAGDVIAGVDLSALRPEDVILTHEDEPGARTATLVLPAPTVLVTRLDSQRTYVHSRNTDLFAKRAESLEGRAREEAERSIKAGAEEAGILDKAAKNAERTVGALVKSLGYSEVHITFRGSAVPRAESAPPSL